LTPSEEHISESWTYLSEYGSVVEVEGAYTSVAEADDESPQRAVEAHRRHVHRKFGAVAQSAHVRRELDDALARVGVPYAHRRRLVRAHYIQSRGIARSKMWGRHAWRVRGVRAYNGVWGQPP